MVLMGDRANVVVRSTRPADLGDREAVYLYSHWGGCELPETLRTALASPAGRGRWDDEQYLARIVFDAMVGEAQGDETGYGISTRLCDNEHPLLVLRDKRVYILPEDVYRSRGLTALDAAPSVSFEDYAAAAERTWDDLGA